MTFRESVFPFQRDSTLLAGYISNLTTPCERSKRVVYRNSNTPRGPRQDKIVSCSRPPSHPHTCWLIIYNRLQNSRFSRTFVVRHYSKCQARLSSVDRSFAPEVSVAVCRYHAGRVVY